MEGMVFVMFCTLCGVELRETDRYCSQCGRATALASAESYRRPVRELRLDKANKKIAGVCAGFARYWEMDLTLLRVIWLVVAICTGVGFIAYAVCWLLVPSDEAIAVPVSVPAHESRS